MGKIEEGSVPISELGELGICERRLYLRSKLGPRTNAQREARKSRGTAIHQVAYAQQRPDERTSDKRCFIATAVYGEDAAETMKLRAFRDSVLLGHWTGRLAVRMYYFTSPSIARACDRSKHLKSAIRVVLDKIVSALGVQG